MNAGMSREWSWFSAAAAATSWLMGRREWAAGFGAAAVALRLWPQNKFNYDGASVVITGGSRGLGLALGEELVRRGARVTLLARDAEELNRAGAQLERGHETRVYTVTCDVTDPEQLEQALHLAHDHFGHVDMWINNAGAITVGPFASMNERDFEAQIRLHMQAPIRSALMLYPYFRERGGGRLVNISSIGGTIPVPHMAPYCTSKFGLAGFSESIASELRTEGIYVTTVYPGLMRTGSPIQAVFKGDQAKEYAWFSLSDNTPGLSLPAERAARRILNAVSEGRRQVLLGWPAKAGHLAFALAPETVEAVLQEVTRWMPSDSSPVRRTGADSRSWVEHQWWTAPLRWLAQRNEQRFNQKRKFDAEFNLGRS